MIKARDTHPGRTSTISKELLLKDLRALGVSAGNKLLVHSSLRSIGWVSGGPKAVVDALQTAVGDTGTLVMPAHTSHISEPGLWRNPRVPPDSLDTIRSTIPAFDPAATPSKGMGAIPECFRLEHDVLRSSHPQDSFIARGPAASSITSAHPLDDGLGEHSPLGRLYKLKAKILLLGVGHESNTSLHLAEDRANYSGRQKISNGAPILVNGQREWVRFQHLEYNIADFRQIGQDFARQTSATTCSFVGHSQACLMPMRALVDFAVDWMELKR